jgi:PilZ domain
MSTEKRNFERREINLGVKIQTADGRKFSGVLSDVSSSGVCLKTSDAGRLPEQFLLRLANELCRWSRIVWRSAEEVGVEFVPFPEAFVEHDITHSVFIKCPNTGKDISTGIQLTCGDISKLSNIRRFTKCRHCQRLHGWTPNEAHPRQIGASDVARDNAARP